jgi:hypothetical protein
MCIGFIWPSCFREEDFFNISQSEKRINLGSHVCWPNGTRKKRKLLAQVAREYQLAQRADLCSV